jgi:biotin transport system substrate-specific component
MNLSIKALNIYSILKISSIFILGVIFLSCMALKKIPLPATSIQMSLQSLSISILVIFLGEKAFWVVLIYLVMATFGFSLLAEGVSNPNWYISPAAGYYFGFLISSFFLAKILMVINPQTFFNTWITLSLNESLILFFGYIFLSFYVGPGQAWWVGVWPYIIGAILKITTATGVYLIKLTLTEHY